MLEPITPGQFRTTPKRCIDLPALIAWLVEAQLRSSNESPNNLSSFLNHPVFFPFQFAPLSSGELQRHNPRLDVMQQGLREDVVLLRHNIG